MKKLLIIAPYFLPRRRVGALRPFKFAIHLQNYGWDPHIITIHSSDTLTQKEQQLLNGISIYELKPPFDRTEKSGRQLKKSSMDSKESTSAIADFIDRHFPVDTWLPFFAINWRKIKQITQSIDPDAIWSTGDPWSAHWVGRRISKLMPDLFWMADFRDPWTLSETDLKERSAFTRAIDKWVERKFIKQASMLSFTTQSTRKLYEDYYSEAEPDAVTIYNAFDGKLFEDNLDQPPDLNIKSKYLNLMFFGRFRRLSSAKPVVDILHALKMKDESLIDKIRIHSFGMPDSSESDYASARGVKRCFVTHDPVPVEQSLGVLQQADLLFLSTNPERKDIIPAKLWDYLAADRPILSIAPNPEIEEILKDTKKGAQYSHQNHKEVAELLVNCIKAKDQGSALPLPFDGDQQKINRYSAESATEKLATILDQHTE